MSVWVEINETGLVSHLIQRGFFLNKTLKDVWDNIRQQKLENSENIEDFYNLFEMKFEYIELCSEYFITKSRFVLQKIEMLEIDINNIEEKDNQGIDFGDLYGWLVKEVGYLDLNTVKVYEFDNILSRAIKVSKLRNSNNGK